VKSINFIVRTIVTLSGIAIISGCSFNSSGYASRPPVSTASQVQINQPLEIPNKKARVYIQNGVVTAKRKLDPWDIYCSVLMQKLHSAGEPKLIVSPGQFEIVKVRENKEEQFFPGNIVASLSEWRYVPPIVIFKLEMRLQSDDQPGVRALICAKQVESYGRHIPTLAEIKSALGTVIEIKVP
jgi:hypothetical protein